MGNLLQDLRYGIRMLLKDRGLTAMAVITIALGIGVNTAIFSVVNTVLLKPAPYRDPERIVQLVHTQQNRMRTMVPPADFADWRNQSQVFESIGASQFLDANLSGDGVPERVRGVLVNSGVFDLLGVSPILGRLPRESEDVPGADPVVLISHNLWQNRFASDPNITGRIIQINSKSYNVIGVMPEGFRFPSPYYAPGELWLLSGQSGVRWDDRKRRSLLVFARLKDGVSLDQAQAEIDVIASRLEQVYPETNKEIGVRLTAYGETSIRGSRPRLLPLFAAAGLVLLIACVNIVNLLLSRGVDRRKEIAIRSALGGATSSR
ncbi:MAG: ABC transporter permease [Blastocatellia bacterium]|nr:ABC transporter permease [Blastocatellia bacterium]